MWSLNCQENFETIRDPFLLSALNVKQGNVHVLSLVRNHHNFQQMIFNSKYPGDHIFITYPRKKKMFSSTMFFDVACMGENFKLFKSECCKLCIHNIVGKSLKNI